MTGETIVFGILAGVAATATMDVLGGAFRRVGLAAGAKGQWVGRWYLGIPRGQFVHSNIALAPELPGEKQTALIGHYLIGIALAVFYIAGAGWVGVPPDGFLLALGYGFLPTDFPRFLLLLALGSGAFALKGPPALKPLTTSLLTHLPYGLRHWLNVKLLPLR